MKKDQADNFNQQIDDLPKEKNNPLPPTQKQNANYTVQHKVEKYLAKDEKENDQRAPEIGDRKEKRREDQVLAKINSKKQRNPEDAKVDQSDAKAAANKNEEN
jgi:hypothetical protein